MKKQSGFTLIELMVVMAIIAILAIAGIAGYIGSVKRARDTTRISDLTTINKALLTELNDTGKSFTDINDVVDAIKSVNNGVALQDPTGTSNCLSEGGTDSDQECAYYYRQCESGAGFVVSTRFESEKNVSRYTKDGIETLTNFEGTTASNADSFWSLGACTSLTCAGSGDCVLNTHTKIIPTT